MHLVDEIKDIVGKELLLLYIRCFCKEYFTPKETYVKVFGLKDLDHESIFNVLWPYLVETLNIQDKLFTYSSDGAHAFSSLGDGVAGMLKRINQWIIIIHCAAHRLQLISSSLEEEWKEVREIILCLYKLDDFLRLYYNNLEFLEKLASLQ